MDKSEQLALIQRVERASGDQAKQALESMILKCTTKHSTIARAIKDAVDRYTPAPTVIYEGRETKDDQDSALTSSHRKPAKKKHQVSESEDDDSPATSSGKHRSTSLRRKKSKNELHEQTKQSGEHGVQSSSPSKKKKKDKEKRKSKHASKHQVEPQQDTDASMGSHSQKQNSIVIDLVTSSDIETIEKVQPSYPNPDKPATDDDLDLFNSSGDEPFDFTVPKKQTATSKKPSDAKAGTGSLRDQGFDTDSSNDTGSEDEQHDPIAGIDESSQGGSGMESTQRGTGNHDGGRPGQSITVSAAKASSHHENTKADALGLDKKRKASDLTLEDMHTNQPANPAPLIHPSKKPKQNHPEEVQETQRGLKCDKCGKKVPIPELLKHRWICKGKAAQDNDHHHVSKASANDQPHQPKPIQKDGGPAGDVVTAERQNNVQLPSRPVQTAPVDRELSMPPPSFVKGPNRLTRGPTPTPIVLARSKAGTQSLPSDCPPPPKSELSPIVSLGNEMQPPRRHPPTQRLLPADQGLPQPPPSFKPKLTSTTCGPSSVPTTLKSLVPGSGSLMHGLVDRPMPAPSSGDFLEQQLQSPETASLRQHLTRTRKAEKVYRCKDCGKRFKRSDNLEGACVCHPGTYQLLTTRQLGGHCLRGGRAPAEPFVAWTCCGQRAQDAPPCIMGRHTTWEGVLLPVDPEVRGTC